MSQTSTERLRDYLVQLPPQSQALLMREFERAIERGEDTTVASFVLEQLRKVVRGADETGVSGTPASASSLRAQRSNPESHRGKTLDCFAALAMTAFVDSTVAPLARAFIADTPSHPRGLFRPSLASSPCPQLKEGAGKTGRRLAPIKTPMRNDCTRNAQGRHRAAETRPSLRDGLTAYAALSPETSSLLPPSPLRNPAQRAG